MPGLATGLIVAPPLQALVFELEQDASDDYRADKPLLARCTADISRLCSQHIQDPHGGEMQVLGGMPVRGAPGVHAGCGIRTCG